MAEAPPILELCVDGLLKQDPRGQLEVAAQIAAAVIFPEPATDILSEAAHWQALSPLRDRLSDRFFPQAERNYQKCRQVGRTLLAWLESQVNDSERLSLAEAKRRQAPRLITDSALEKHWRTWRHVAHFCAAHLVFETAGCSSVQGVLSFPCNLDWLAEFLLFADALREDAARYDLPRAETMLALDPALLRNLRASTPGNRVCGIVNAAGHAPIRQSLIALNMRKETRCP